MSIFVSYISMLIFFIVAEIIVLTNIMQPLFKKHIGFLMKEETNFSIAAIFYLVYVAGVFWFATRAGIKSESSLVAIFSGAFLGLLAFGTYEITNYVILKDWKISLVLIDTLWGIIISSSMAYVGYKAHSFFS
ncbi:MAG: DUF2177 family protein [Paracoccaceae bacterium]